MENNNLDLSSNSVVNDPPNHGSESVSVRNYILLFCGIYIGLTAVFIGLKNVLNQQSTSSPNIIIIVISIITVRAMFNRKYARAFTRSEYSFIVLGSLGFDYGIQFLTIFLFFGWTVLLSSKFGGIMLILLSHGLLIAVGYLSLGLFKSPQK